MTSWNDEFLKALEEDEKNEREFVDKLKSILLSMDARIKRLEEHSHSHLPPSGGEGK